MNAIKKMILATLFAFAALTANPALAATIHVPDSFLYDAVTGAIDVNTDTIKCGLATSGYTYNRATHTKRSDVTEVTGTGYTAGGQTVAVTVTNNTTLHKLVIDIPQIVWSGSTTITARQLFCYKSRGGASTADELIVFADFGSDVISSGGTFTVNAIAIEYTHF
ncbi:hypothetical protein [Propionivibrio sp.]|uniref:hypothetical protein n=1 Tax=Propionivibrio sp. TaxID=2212460 RepID=UPI0025CE67AC|nr:hypothetical protein [Propionivibrio sp.]MBK8399954.1 hypothetical protein [Propionivibrio sp.]MBK8745611.1 hypothetical protein [Propionivibrio sp.]